MAADVQKDEMDFVDIESCSIVSDYAAQTLSEVSLESDYVNGELPSYAIVYQQMREVLGLQKVAGEQHFQSNIDALNASKQCLNNTLECQGKTIKNLEVSIQNDYVLKQDFLELQEKLKIERDKNKDTQASLSEALNKLDASQKEAAALSRQIELEKEAFEKCSDSLREDIQELKLKNRGLNSIITDKNLECEELKSHLSNQKQELGKLKNKHEEQKVKFKQKVTESEVEKQQEAYLRQMTNEEGSNRKKGKSLVSH